MGATKVLILAVFLPFLYTFTFSPVLSANIQAKNNHRVEAESLYHDGLQQIYSGEFEEALQFLQQALLLFHDLDDIYQQANALFLVGQVYVSLKNHELGTKYYQKSLLLYQQIGDLEGQANVLARLGNVYIFKGEYQQAEFYYQQALVLYKDLNDLNNELYVMARLGWTHYYRAQYQRAISLFQETLQFQDNEAEKTYLLYAIGQTYSALGQHQQAIDFYQQSISAFERINNADGLAFSLAAMGWSFYNLKEYTEAIEFHQQALAIREAESDLEGQAFSWGGLGAAYVELGQYEKARELHYRQLLAARQVSNRLEESRALSDLAKVYIHLNHLVEAEQYYQRSLAIAQEIENHRDEGATLAQIGRLLNLKGQNEIAVVFLKQSVNVREMIRTEIQDLPLELQRSYTTTIADDYRFLADLLVAKGRPLEALQVLELLKAEEIREYTRGTVTNVQTGEIQLSSTEAEVVQRYNSLVQLGLKIEDCENEVRSCSIDDVIALNDDRKRLTEEYNAAISALELDDDRITPDPSALITEGVAEVLNAQPNTMLIYPVVLEDRLVLLWATRGGVANAIEVPQVTEADINQAAFEFRQLMRQCEISGCTTEDIPAVQAVAQRLHQWLMPQDLENLLQQEGIENLVFALDQQLRYIPMATLYDGEHYLTERYNLSTVTAAWLTPVGNPLPTTPSEVSVLALGLSEEVPDTNPADDLPYFAPLDYVPLELDGIVRQSNADDPSGVYSGINLLNQDFDDRAFYRLKVDGYQILHIATHGVFVPTNLHSSYLMLGNRQDWRISEIQSIGQQFTDLSLVVLSACETALGGSQQSASEAEALDGREISGIAQTFLDAGADAILASLWKVSDASTSALMQQFYLELASGTEANPVTYSAALQRAQTSLITGNLAPEVEETLNRSIVEWDDSSSNRAASTSTPDLSHPFYWAPFTLIGNGL